MQCPQCNFENMPGQTSCFRCGSLLDGKALTVDVHPPRAPAWKKPFRSAGRWVRRCRAARKAEQLAKRATTGALAAAGDGLEGLGFQRVRAEIPPWVELRRAMWQAAVGLALSIAPGGAQLAQHRFRSIRFYVIAWAVALALGVCLYGSTLGVAALSVAVVIHAWIAMDAVVVLEQFKEIISPLARMVWRLMGVLVLAVLIYLMYRGIRDVAAPGMTVGQSGIAVPAHDVALEDSILCRGLTRDPPLLRRGDLVLVKVSPLYGGAYRPYYSGGPGEAIGQLIGLPGDAVKLTRDAGFIVNDQKLDPDKFPVPKWLRGQQLSVALGKRDYFVTMEYRIGGGATAELNALIQRACVRPREEVMARGFMRWFPLRKRGFLRELE